MQALLWTGGCAGRLGTVRSTCIDATFAPPRPAAADLAAVYPVVEGPRGEACSCGARRSGRCLEPYLGIVAGVSLPETQDLKAKRFDAAGVLIDDLFSADVDTSTEFFASLHAGAWVTQGPLRNFGFEAQYMHWTTRAAGDALAPKPGHASTGALPPFDSVMQERNALFGCLLWRFFLTREGADSGRGAYAFVGAGAGVVHTVVDHGPKDWAPGAEAFAGVAVPLSERVRLRLDVRWITTHDADSKGTSPNWRVDTSGTPSWPRSPHFDTRFLVPALSVEIDL